MIDQKTFNWFTAAFVIVSPIISLYGFYACHPDWKTAIFSFVYYIMSGLAISIGYHRLFCHGTFKTSSIMKAILLFIGSSGFQGSCLVWCRDHRNHHNHIDSDKDPCSIKKGFLYAHIGWLFWNEDRYKKDYSCADDLLSEPWVKFQNKFYFFISSVKWNCCTYSYRRIRLGRLLGRIFLCFYFKICYINALFLFC